MVATRAASTFVENLVIDSTGAVFVSLHSHSRTDRDDPERERALIARTPGGRIAEAEEVVGAAILLASPAGAYISGQVLLIDGARSVT
jgi:NAD(P)-dependent dehydrogenase (short-subunit alcohol dehydrogenase family)